MNVAYGQKHMLTPAFDRLATEGSVFTRAYCNIAVCAPSRNSFMSGLRPDVTGIFNFNNHIRQEQAIPPKIALITPPNWPLIDSQQTHLSTQAIQLPGLFLTDSM